MDLGAYLRSSGLSQAGLGELIGVSQGQVSHWVVGRLRVDPSRVLPIVRATGGAVRPYDLRPDIYPDPDWMPDLTPVPPPDDQEAA